MPFANNRLERAILGAKSIAAASRGMTAEFDVAALKQGEADVLKACPVPSE